MEAITYRNTDYVYGRPGQAGPITTELYRRLTGIQSGEIADPYGWTEVIAEGLSAYRGGHRALPAAPRADARRRSGEPVAASRVVVW